MALYIEALPRGLDSYPECRIKAGLCREVVASFPRPPKRLPAALAELVGAMPPVSSWISEVHHQAVIEATVDEFYSSRESYLDFAYECQRRLFSARIYSPLLQLISPERLLRQAAKRWGNFHRGSTLEVLRGDKKSATIRVHHPGGLFSVTGLRSLAEGFRAAINASRAKQCDVLIVEREQAWTTYRLHWTV